MIDVLSKRLTERGRIDLQILVVGRLGIGLDGYLISLELKTMISQVTVRILFMKRHQVLPSLSVSSML